MIRYYLELVTFHAPKNDPRLKASNNKKHCEDCGVIKYEYITPASSHCGSVQVKPFILLLGSGDDCVDVDIIERLIGVQKKVRKIKIEIVCFNKKLSEKSGTTFKWTLYNVRRQ